MSLLIPQSFKPSSDVRSDTTVKKSSSAAPSS
nr:MAG TPA: hypothetical protein [Caudoviricetes sp.]